MEIKKYDVVEAKELKPGDRFYFQSDRLKKVHEVSKGKKLIFRFPFAIWLVRYDAWEKYGIEKFCRRSTKVVYLRTKN